MKKNLFFIMVFAMCAYMFACGEKEDAGNEVPKETNAAVSGTVKIESAPGEEIQEVLVNVSPDNASAENGKIVINRDFLAKAAEDSMQLDFKDYEFYQISSFSNLNKKDYKFYIVSQIQIYDDISSLLILAASEHENACWLVNYGKKNKYIDALVVGYDEWADGSNGIDSVINTKTAPYYIDITNRSQESKEAVKAEVLPSGKFKEISRVNVGTGI